LALSSCSDSPTTINHEADPPDQGSIDPHGNSDFLIGSTPIPGTAGGNVEVWGHNLTVESESRVSFDAVLSNGTNDTLYPFVLFYVTKTIPSSVRVLDYDSKGFGNSFVFDFSDDLGSDDRLDPGERTRPVRMRFELPALSSSFAIGFLITVGTPPAETGCSIPYPVTLFPLPPEALQDLREEFAAQNPNICSGLNLYGFASGQCATSPKRLPPDTDVEALIAAVKETLAANARFTGVSDPSALVATSRILYRGELRVYFGRQIFDGREVVGTEIRVHVDSLGVRSIDGHHYPEICIPEPPIVSGVQAQESLIGLDIVWYDFAGLPRAYEVTEEALVEAPTRVVLPHERGGSVQLRVAWRVRVGRPHDLAWYAYVDTMDRALLGLEQLFQT
jgi:hypothetical protein